MSKDWANTCRDVNLGVLYDPQTIKIDLHESVKVQDKGQLFPKDHSKQRKDYKSKIS